MGCVVAMGLLGVHAFASGADALPAKDARAARKLYVAKCAKCHRFYDPTNYTAFEWRGWMDKMSAKAVLKPGQTELLNRYLDAYRAGQLDGKPQERVRERAGPGEGVR